VAEIAAARPDLRLRLVTGSIGDDHITARGSRHIDLSLDRLGVEVITGARVAEVDHDRIVLTDGRELPADLTVWCGGFVCPPIATEAGLTTDARSVVITDGMCRSVSHPQVLAAGDACRAAAVAVRRQLPDDLPVGWAGRRACGPGDHRRTARTGAGTVPVPLRA
jgi:NADH dehydrogenase FAD-containing subunit